MKRNQTIQANVSQDFKEEFNDLYNESGANSKGEFLRGLVDNYLNPETIVKSQKKDLDRITDLEEQVEQLSNESVAITELQEQVDLLTTENTQLKNRPPEIRDVPIELEENQLLLNLDPFLFKVLKFASNHEATMEEQNYYAESESFNRKWGAFTKPLNEGDEIENMKKTLMNMFYLTLVNGGSYLANFSNRSIRKAHNDLEKDPTKHLKGFWD